MPSDRPCDQEITRKKKKVTQSPRLRRGVDAVVPAATLKPFASISIGTELSLVTPTAKVLYDVDRRIRQIPSIVPLGHESSQ